MAKRLDPGSFHITVHDLISGLDKKDLNKEGRKLKIKIKKTFSELAGYLKENPEEATINLKSTGVYNSSNISVVIGFIPEGEKDYRRLLNADKLFDDIVNLDRLLRPHITLGYFKAREFSGDEIKKLYDSLIKINRSEFCIKMNLWDIVYQCFYDMNNYEDIISLADLKKSRGDITK